MTKKLTLLEKLLRRHTPAYFTTLRVIQTTIADDIGIIIPLDDIEKELEQLAEKGLIEKEMQPIYRQGELEKFFIVFGLDDTLACTAHRQPLLEQAYATESEKWQIFFEACDRDTPRQEIITIFEALASSDLFDYKIEIWTERSETVGQKTREWLNTHVGGSVNCSLRMRAEGDFRPDTEIKRDWIRQYGTPNLVFDDRNKMVAFWREQGILCCQPSLFQSW